MGHGAHQLYRDYQDDVERGMTILVANGVQPTRFPDQTSATRYLRLKRWYHRLRGSIGFAPQRSVVA